MTKQTLEEELKGVEFRDNLFGEPYFIYEEPCGNRIKHSLREVIPKKILYNGEKAVMEYAVQKLKEAKKKWKEFKDAKDAIRKNPISIQTKYKKGILLEGRIIRATTTGVRVELDKPLKGEWGISFGYASAMAGQYVFTKNKLSKHAYDAAYSCLRHAYQEGLRKPEKDLMSRLNKKIGGN